MKTIGLIGTTSFVSNCKYVEVINKTVNLLLGGQHTAHCVHYTFDFHAIERLLATEQWGALQEIVVGAAVSLEKDGADFLVLCSNVMHKLLPEIERAVDIPILHVVEVVSEELVDNGIETIGVIGTKLTMKLDYHQAIPREKGIETIVPKEGDMDILDCIIFDELCHGVVNDKSKRAVLRIMDDLAARGAEAIVLACTELSMLVDQTDTDIPLYDATPIHAERAALLAIREDLQR